MALLLTAILTCPRCGTDFDAWWADEVMDVQDMAEAPVAEQTCPACGHAETVEYPGWSFRAEAG